MFLPTLYVNHVKQSPGEEVGAVCTPGQEAVFCFLQIFFFLMWTIFKVFIALLQYCICVMFWTFGHEACGILARRPGLELTRPALEGEVPTTGPPGKSQEAAFERAFGSSRSWVRWSV